MNRQTPAWSCAYRPHPIVTDAVAQGLGSAQLIAELMNDPELSPDLKDLMLDLQKRDPAEVVAELGLLLDLFQMKLDEVRPPPTAKALGL